MGTQSIKDRVWRYGPLILWMALISLASTDGFSAMNTSRVIRPLLLWLFPTISEERIQLAHFLVRKTAHFTEYGVLALLAARAFWSSSRELLRRSWFLAALLLVFAHSLLDEYHQSLVPSRSASLLDCVIDISGGLVALAVLAYFQRQRDNRLLAVGSNPTASRYA